MNLIPIPAATQLLGASFMDTLPHLLGMLMVMLTLTALWGICASTAKIVKTLVPEQKTATAPAAATTTTAAAKPEAVPAPAAPAGPVGITPEIVAVIAAAVASTVGQSVRIISIKPISSSWERAGRQSVLTSHRIR